MGIGCTTSSYKLLLMQGMSSRPRYRGLFETLLRPFVHEGVVTVRARQYGTTVTSIIRVSELESDYMSTRELAVEDVYALDRNFRPDLIVDGGGNIGLFTVRATNAYRSDTGAAPHVVICEPVPANLAQIKKMLATNGMQAEIRPLCLGGEQKTIPFYCREANQSSFDPARPYASVMQIPVVTLKDVVGARAERILIKLDIEGMEVEALSSFIPSEQRPVYIVGELHEVSRNAAPMRELFARYGWTLKLAENEYDVCGFWGCSPAALPLLPSMKA